MLLTRSPLYSRGCPRFLVRLACVRHAASVDSEPGSNSRLKPDRPGKPGRCRSPGEGRTAIFVRSLEQRPKRLKFKTGSPPRLRVMRSFNFSRLARSTCCQRPFHLTPERGGSVGADPLARVLETPGTHLNGSCWETFQPYRESRCPSTRAPEVSPARINFGTAALPRPFRAERAEAPSACCRFQGAPSRKAGILNKRSLGGLAIVAKPFGELCPRIETPWPGPISYTIIVSDVSALARDSLDFGTEWF